MTNPKKDWHTDWRDFIDSVADDFRNGLSDEEVSSKYAHQKVVWIGTIDEFNYNEFFKCVRLKMPRVDFKTKNRRSGFADFLSIYPHADEADAWLELKPGTAIEFEAELHKETHPSLAVEYSEIGDYVKIRTKKTTKLLKVVEK